MQADALLAEEDGTAVLALDQRGGDTDDGCRQRQADSRASDVQRALRDALPALHRVPSGRSQTGSMPLKSAS